PDPPVLRRARAAILSGNACKLILRFREAFWDERGRGRLDFLHDDRAPFPTWWTASPWRVPVLTAWAGGPRADALAGLTAERLVARAFDALAGMLGRPRRRIASLLSAWHVHDWRADPWSRGAYSAV